MTASAVTEARYQPSDEIRDVPCACGGRLRALNDLDCIREAVIVHQETTRHTLWADAHFERARFGPEPTAGLSRSLVDVSEGITAGPSAPSRNGALA